MERFTISKSEKQTIFEIYRACRLCGAGGGYRMPIIQNIVDLDGSDVELKQKIQDCLQLEVRSDDRMPPLICEICVDKVNDFHKFMEMARHTNIRTRTRLGLPLQTVQKGEREESDNGDCILGVTEPLHEEPASKKSKAGPKCSKKIKNEEETVKVKEEVAPSPKDSRSSSVSSRSSRAGQRPSPQPSRAQRRPSPKQQVNPPVSQPSRSQSTKTAAPKITQVPEKKGGKDKKTKEKETQENEVKRPAKKISRKEVENLIQDTIKYEESSLLAPRAQKRVREHELPKPLIIPKRPKPLPKEPVKEPTIEPVKEPTPPPRPKPRPKSKQDPKNLPAPLRVAKPKAKPAETPPKIEQPKTFNCAVCNMQLKTIQALTNHTKYHIPNYTKPQNACNPCGEWFPTTEEATAHHRHHRAAPLPYRCRRCRDDYRSLPDYDRHIANNQCVPWETVPDVKCEDCWKTFPTQTLRLAHKCPGVDARPGGKCSKCSKTYTTHRNLKKHESACIQRRKRDLIADPDVLRRLKPMQVRISRCDDLLANAKDGYYDVATVKPNHGLDRHYLYPYMTFRVKSEPPDRSSKATIHGPGKPECERDSYIHWDSEDSDSDNVKQVDSLVTLSIKKLFSRNLLGKVPRKRRKIRNEGFDCNDFGDMCSDINIIINSLGDDSENDSVGRSKNELLMASLNDIIGVPNDSGDEAGNETVVRNDDVNESKTASSEINKLSINDSVNNVEGVDSLFRDREPGNEILTGNDDVNVNESKIVTSENISDFVNDEEDEGSLSKDREQGNETVTENENDGGYVNKSTLTSENKHAYVNDADNDNRLPKDREPVIETEARNHNYDVNINLSDTVSSEKSELSNISESMDVVDDHDSLSKDKGNEIFVRNENDSSIDKSDTALSDTHLISNKNAAEDFLSSVMVTENETEDDENDDVNTNVGNEDESEYALNEKSEVSNLIDTEIRDEGVNATFNNVGEVRTHQHILETEDVGGEQSNDIENICDVKKTSVQQVIDQSDDENNSEKTQEIRIDSENVNNFENKEEPINSEISLKNPVDLETQLAAMVEEEYTASVNGINYENDIDIKDSKTNSDCNESESNKIELINPSNKESPIKHSIDNIIGDTDKNPEKYIDEVISTLENIIMKNPRKEDDNSERLNGETRELDAHDIDDQNLMDALDAQIGDEDLNTNESDKITLEDLLPQGDRTMQLDDISDEDFNFDD